MYKISVAMATYNGEKFLKDQIDSILKNLNCDDELIISDDGSLDSTKSIITSYNDSRIKLIEGPHEGIIKNFENAISKCSGDYIFLCDQDDVWFDNKVEIVINYMKMHDYILVVHDNKMINEHGDEICNSFFKYRKCKNGLINNIIRNSFIGCCITFKKELIKEILPIPSNMPMHDQWIGLIALLNGNVSFFNRPLIYYRRHQNNNSSFKKNSVFKMIKNRFIILNNIIKYKRRRKWKN